VALRFLDRYSYVRTLRSDPVRLPIQTVVAVALAYLAGLLLATPNVSWSVFSAIFVVQASAGATWGVAIDRTSGALVGSALGCMLVLLATHLGVPPMATMLIGVALMSVAAAYRPGLSYGLVTVAILTVAPGGELVEDAVEKVWAIALGSLSAALAGSVVLPVSVHRRARQDLSQTAEALALWLDASTQSLLDREAGPIDTHHSQMDRALEDARATLWGAGEWLPGRRQAHNRAVACRDSLLALRYSVTILDRLGWTPIPEHIARDIKDPVLGISSAAQALIKRIGGLELVRVAPDALPTLKAELHSLRELIAQLLRSRADVDDATREHLSALAWAWGTLARQLERAAHGQCGDRWRNAA